MVLAAAGAGIAALAWIKPGFKGGLSGTSTTELGDGRSRRLDSTTWYYEKANKNCKEWVMEDVDKRCRDDKYFDEAGVSPLEACPVSCGACD